MPPTPSGFQRLPLAVAQLSLPAVLKCGQSFRWQVVVTDCDEPSNSGAGLAQEWRLPLSDRLICLRQAPDALFFRAIFPEGSALDVNARDKSTLAWLKDYFQLDVDLEKLYAEWSERDPVFKGISRRFSGIRIMRQDPWENVVSFICSQNNHISRITSMVQNLCTHFSPPLPLSLAPDIAISYHPFPSPQALKDPSVENTLRELGFGYRAKYIQKTAAMLCDEHDNPEAWLPTLRKMEAEKAKEELLRLHGVGPKVADCVLLMSLDKPAIVPVDTHVYQIAVKHYGYHTKGKASSALTPKMHAEIARKLQDIWGVYAGWAHCVLFTADLRAFKAYGLEATETVAKEEVVESQTVVKTETEETIVTVVEVKRKKKRKSDVMEENFEVSTVVETVENATGSLGERVKARSRLWTMKRDGGPG